MLTADMTQQIETSTWFHRRHMPYLLVDTDFRIRAVNPAYAHITAQPAFVGERLFDVFPDNPADPTADGVSLLSSSLEAVFSGGIADWMGVQRYDIPDPDERGAFRFKVWTPVNYPIRVDGATVAILHHVQDITVIVDRDHPAEFLPGLLAAADTLWRRLPNMPRKTVIGVLADSRRVIIDTLGRPDDNQALELATLRLEARAGHPADQLAPHHE